MSRNQKTPLIVNRPGDLPSNSVSPPFKWNGLDVAYLSTAFSRYPIHNHRFVQITVPLRTAGFEAVTLSSTGKRRSFQKLSLENVLVIPGYQPHTLLWNTQTEIVMFDLEPEFIEHAAGDAFREGEFEIAEKENVRDPFITQLGFALYREFISPSAAGRIYIESLAAMLAVHLLRDYSIAAGKAREFSGGLSGVRLRRAVEYIEAHLGHDLSLTQIADAIGMSPYYFSRALKKSTGLAPHSYVVVKRIEHAKKLLLETRMTITEIAASVGYANQAHFSTGFRKLVGVSPSAYRTKV